MPMAYYTWTTLLGVFFMALSALGLALYLLLLIFANAFFGNDAMFYTIGGLFFVGYVLFKVRGAVMDGLALQVRRHGLHTTATVLASEQVGTEEVSDHQMGDWYELKLRVDATAHGESPFLVYVDQLFRPEAAGSLAPGSVVQVRYSSETGLTVVTGTHAYGRLGSGSFRVFGRLRRPVPS